MRKFVHRNGIYMVKKQRIRAERNRTLTVSEEEEAGLKENILYFSDIGPDTPLVDRIINGDILDVVDFIPDESVDLIIVDPPYNLSKTFNSSKFSATSEEKYETYLRTWFHKVCSKLKPDGTLYMCGDWKSSSSQQRVIEEELCILNRITWQREKGRGAKSNWKNAMEDIWFAVKDNRNYHFDVDAVKMKRQVIAPYRKDGKPKDWEETQSGKFRVTFPSNFWDDISIPFWSMPENTDHPTQKPEKLIAKLVLASSGPGDIVFDPFAGSGTTCVVASKLGRRYIGVDIDEEYCMWGVKRLKLAEMDKEIQGYCDGCFWERNTLNMQMRKQTEKRTKKRTKKDPDK